MMTKIRKTFSLDSEVVKRLEELARRTNRSQSNKIEVLIDEAHEKLIKENGNE